MRMLLTAQIFCTSAAQGYPSNVNGAPPWFSLVQGGNLFETLVRNMVYRDQIKVPFDDPPVFWRNTAVVESKKAVAQTSWLYGMLFPARRIHLLPREDGTDGRTLFQPRHELFGSRQLARPPRHIQAHPGKTLELEAEHRSCRMAEPGQSH